MGILIYLIIGGLAAHRLAEIVVVDNIFMGVRGFFNAPQRPIWVKESIGDLVNCVHCAGVWICAPIAYFIIHHNPIADGVILFFALAGLQSIISNKLGRK